MTEKRLTVTLTEYEAKVTMLALRDVNYGCESETRDSIRAKLRAALDTKEESR